MECNKRTKNCVISSLLVRCYGKEVLVFLGMLDMILKFENVCALRKGES